jgi:hypothetical protein
MDDGAGLIVDEELLAELLTRRDADQRVRQQVSGFVGNQEASVPDDLAAEWERVDEGNTRWLGELLATRGWPGRTLVGDEGTQAAWLLAQHADRDPDLQRAFLEALRGAVAHGEAPPACLAYLEDRVRLNAGQPQLYGTQFLVTEGMTAPYQIEDPGRLDERRASVGLEPFAVYELLIRSRT